MEPALSKSPRVLLPFLYGSLGCGQDVPFAVYITYDYPHEIEGKWRVNLCAEAIVEGSVCCARVAIPGQREWEVDEEMRSLVPCLDAYIEENEMRLLDMAKSHEGEDDGFVAMTIELENDLIIAASEAAYLRGISLSEYIRCSLEFCIEHANELRGILDENEGLQIDR